VQRSLVSDYVRYRQSDSRSNRKEDEKGKNEAELAPFNTLSSDAQHSRTVRLFHRTDRTKIKTFKFENEVL